MLGSWALALCSARPAPPAQSLQDAIQVAPAPALRGLCQLGQPRTKTHTSCGMRLELRTCPAACTAGGLAWAGFAGAQSGNNLTGACLCGWSLAKASGTTPSGAVPMPMRRTSIAGGVVDGAGVGAVRAVGRHDAVHQGLGALVRVLVAVVSCTAHARFSPHKSK